MALLPDAAAIASLIGRLYDPEASGSCLVQLRGDRRVDVTTAGATLSRRWKATTPPVARPPCPTRAAGTQGT